MSDPIELPPVSSVIAPSAAERGRGDGPSPPIPLGPGETYTAVVVRVLGIDAEGVRLEAELLDRLITLRSPDRYPVGTILELRAVPSERDWVLRIVAAVLPRSRETRAVGAASSAAGRAVVDRVPVERLLAAAGVTDLDGRVARIAAVIRAHGLPVGPAVAVAAELVGHDLPVDAQLLRGGVAAARGLDLVASSELTHRLVRFVEAHVDEPAARARVLALVDRAAAAETTSAAEVVFARLRPALIERALTELVRWLTRGDSTLESIRAAYRALERGPVRSGDAPLPGHLFEGGARVRQLLAASGLLDEHEAFRDLTPPARRRGLELVSQIERKHLERQPWLPELRALARELLPRLEATGYLQWLEWASHERPDSFLGAGFATQRDERLPYRFTVRDERGPGGGLGFRIEVQTRELGKIRVEGRLETTGAESGDRGELDLRLSATEAGTGGLLRADLESLLEALVEAGYAPRARVDSLTERPTPATSIDPPTRVDLKA